MPRFYRARAGFTMRPRESSERGNTVTTTVHTNQTSSRRIGVSVLLAGTILAGCSNRIVVSEPQSASPGGVGGEPGGLVYSLPQTIITVDGTKDDKGQVTYAIVPSIMPDATARYRLRYTTSGTTDDDINLTVDANGLLTSGMGTVTDQTGAIIVTLAKTAASFINPPFAKALTQMAAKPTVNVYPFHKVYSLQEFLQGPELPDHRRLSVANIGSDVSGPSPNCTFSVCYRTTVLIRGKVTEAGKDQGADFAFLAVDPSSTEGMDIRSAALVKRTDNVTFTNGIATGNAIKQDSSVLAAANLPLDVVKAILSAPAELLTLKINNVTDQANLIQQQANLLAQQTALINARKTLDQTQSAATTGGAVTGTGTSP